MEADRAENGVGTEMIQAVYEAWQAKPDRWSLPVAWFAIGLSMRPSQDVYAATAALALTLACMKAMTPINPPEE